MTKTSRIVVDVLGGMLFGILFSVFAFAIAVVGATMICSSLNYCTL